MDKHISNKITTFGHKQAHSTERDVNSLHNYALNYSSDFLPVFGFINFINLKRPLRATNGVTGRLTYAVHVHDHMQSFYHKNNFLTRVRVKIKRAYD